MKSLKQVFDFYLTANIHVALSAAALTKLTLLIFGIAHEHQLLWFVFFATILSYGFIAFYALYNTSTYNNRLVFSQRKAMLILNLLSFIYIVYFSFGMTTKAVAVLIPFLVSVVFYIVPFKGKHYNLRSVAGFKLFLIAFTWAGVTVLFPAVYTNQPVDSEMMLVFIQRVFFILANAIPFDIRDTQFDHGSLKTIPQLFGRVWAKVIGSVFLLLFFGIEFFRSEGEDLLITGLITVLSWTFLIFSREDQNRYYTAFWVEAIPVIWVLMYMGFHHFNN